MKIQKYIPQTGKNLAAYKGAELIDRIGEETVKEVVGNVLCGSNIRSLTENLTRKRIALSNAAMLMTYLDASQSIENLQKNLFQLVGDELIEPKKRVSKEEKQYLQWLVGLTGKSVQNVLRGSKGECIEYLNDLEKVLKESADEAVKIFGDLTGSICIKDKETNLSWPVLTQIFTAIGAQTLSIRGSEKSMYGKLFEKFIMGSVLTMLGFTYTEKKNLKSSDMVFWLSERGEKRESDATILVKAGVGVRFDIGFIGVGNTEISLDKVSRFETEMNIGSERHFMTTLIIVDRIGEKSRITEMAEAINGHIVQMSMSYWVQEVAKILNQTTDFNHKIIGLSPDDSLKYIKKAMKAVDLKTFI